MHSVLSFALFALLAASAQAKDDSILPNGGFEEDLKGWQLINNSGSTTSELDRKDRKEGKQSLHLHKKSGGQPFDTLRTDLPKLPAKKKVTVSAQFKAKDLQNGWFKIFFYDRNGTVIKQGADVKSVAGNYKWKEIKITNKVPEGTESAAVFILLVSAGELWIDDVRVTVQGMKIAKPRKLDRSTKSWLDKNAVKISSLDFNESMDDLEPLAKVLKDVRIVQLGEQSHGDGATFRAKARLVRFLHEKMDFDLLAFESGLYECEAANLLFEAGEVKDGMFGSIFGIWRVEETLPLFRYMAEQAEGQNPLRLTGFDTRGSGMLAKEFLPQLHDFMAPVGSISDDDKDALTKIEELLFDEPYKPDETDREKVLAALSKLRELLDSNRDKLVNEHGERTVEFYSHCLDNYVIREAFEFAKNDPDKHLSSNIRDEQMAKNLRWLAEVYYPEKKIICWAATSHLAHNLTKVSIRGDRNFYKHWKNMGHYVHDWFGEAVYTIGFAAYEGEGGICSPRFTIDEPQEGSLEDLFNLYGEELLFVDLRRRNPFRKALYCSPMSYDRTIKAPWPEVLDGIFFTREMTSSHPARFD